MGLKCMKFIFSSLLITSVFASCGIWQKRDIEGRLISEMAEDCKRVVIKMDYDKGVYVITYTGEVSKDGCPVALLQGWKDERLIKEKELENCGCTEAKGRWKKETNMNSSMIGEFRRLACWSGWRRFLLSYLLS